MNSKYDEALLSAFASGFFGYGSLKSKTWLIGPEQGGGQTAAEVYARAEVWSARGRHATDDLHSYHDDLKHRLHELKIPFPFDSRRDNQATWRPLIRVLLELTATNEVGAQQVRQYQGSNLGCMNGEHRNCVLDLLSFSSPKKSKWNLAELGPVWLKTKQAYKDHVVARRCRFLRKQLIQRKPKLVIFYDNGIEELGWWSEISEHKFSQPERMEQVLMACDKQTVFAVVPHPSNLNTRLPEKGPGAVNRFWASVAEELREFLSK